MFLRESAHAEVWVIFANWRFLEETLLSGFTPATPSRSISAEQRQISAGLPSPKFNKLLRKKKKIQMDGSSKMKNMHLLTLECPL